MIIKEIVEIKGAQYEHIFSNCGKQLQRDDAIYDEVFNPIGSNREYIEIERTEEATEEDYQRALRVLGVEL